jgi:hypothetical protein
MTDEQKEKHLRLLAEEEHILNHFTLAVFNGLLVGETSSMSDKELDALVTFSCNAAEKLLAERQFRTAQKAAKTQELLDYIRQKKA